MYSIDLIMNTYYHPCVFHLDKKKIRIFWWCLLDLSNPLVYYLNPTHFLQMTSDLPKCEFSLYLQTDGQVKIIFK